MAWFGVTRLGDGLYRIAERLDRVEPRFGIETVNMYLVVGGERAALIDSGCGIGDLRAVVDGLTDLPVLVLNSHTHWDHVGGNGQFDQWAVHALEADLLPVEPDLSEYRQSMAQPERRAQLPDGFDPARWRICPPPATRLLRQGDRIDLGGRQLLAIHTPGHSPGHTAFFDLDQGTLFTADLAYQGPVFACFEDGDPPALAASALLVSQLEGVRLICPGHGEPIREPGWLGRFATAAAEVLSGQAVGQQREAHVVGVEHAFDDFAIWMPAAS